MPPRLAVLAALTLLAPVSPLKPPTTKAQQDDRLRPLDGSCFAFARQGEFWGYEWCHRRWVKQFQAAWAVPPGERRQETTVGTFSPALTARLKGNVTEHAFADGERCGRRGTKRRATVRLRCCPERQGEGSSGRNVYISDVTEPATCAYAIDVCARLACDTQEERRSFGGGDAVGSGPMPLALKREYRDRAKRLFERGYDAYVKHAEPEGELRPRSCTGGNFDLVRLPLVTLVDSLDALAILGNSSEFDHASKRIWAGFPQKFDFDVNVSVFETTIRLLGGLLSGHLFAVDESLNLTQSYDGELLALALDLGERLAPAFDTPTSIPFGTVNLRYGVPHKETPVASLAGAGSLSLEFGVLSALTGDPSFATKASSAAKALYERRSPLGLFGKHINVRSGKWVESLSGVGSNSDSFYEYLLKTYVLFQDADSWRMFEDAYSQVDAYARQGDWFADVDMHGGKARRQHFENLQAFYPGLQVLAGDLELASRSLNAFWSIWADWGALPEEYDYARLRLVATRTGLRYPLRPELVEATYFLHQATQDDSWLWAASRVFEVLEEVAEGAQCGAASLANAATHALEDEMPSFYLAETVKYLYLLFDDENFIRKRPFVFTTEAHPFDAQQIKQLTRAPRSVQIIETAPPAPSKNESTLAALWRRLRATTTTRPALCKKTWRKREEIVQAPPVAAKCLAWHWWDDLGYQAAFVPSLASTVPSCVATGAIGRRRTISPRCYPNEAPEADEDEEEEEEEEEEEDATPPPSRARAARRRGDEEPRRGRAQVEGLGAFDVEVFSDGFHVGNRADGETLEVSNVGSSMMLVTSASRGSEDVSLAVSSTDGLEVQCSVTYESASYPCVVAAFGTAAEAVDEAEGRVDETGPLAAPADGMSCDGNADVDFESGAVLLVKRGACTFEAKARQAEASGASALIVANSVPGQARFAMARADDDAPEDIVGIPCVMVSHEDGLVLAQVLGADVSLSVAKTPVTPRDGFGVAVDPGKSVHVSGRGRWGVFLDAKAGSSDAWQLYIVKTAAAARAVENETLCFPKLMRGCDAYVRAAAQSVDLDFYAAAQAAKCRCPANSSCGG